VCAFNMIWTPGPVGFSMQNCELIFTLLVGVKVLRAQKRVESILTFSKFYVRLDEYSFSYSTI